MQEPGHRPYDVTVRAATLGDAERLAEVNVDAWRYAYAGLVPDDYLDALSAPDYAERWRTRLTGASNDQVCLVALVDDVVVSYAAGGRYRTQQDAPPGEVTAGWGELFAIYAHPAMQGRGAGSAVHRATVAALADRGFVRAGLWVLTDNIRSVAWYERRGWRPDGATSMWLGSGQPLPEIRLCRDLAE